MVVPVLFGLEPKSRVEDLYDFRVELGGLWDGYRFGRVVLVLGLRRMGKSSLVRSFLNSYGVPHVLIDVRGIVVDEGRVTVRGFMGALARALSDFLGRHASFRDRLLGLLSRVSGVSVSLSPPSISLSWGRGSRAPLTEVLGAVDEVAREVGVRVAIAIDEVQELRALNMNIPALVAYVYDNLPNVVMILTGSQVGLVYDTLRLDDPDSPLYGRALREVRLRRLGREEAMDFLRLGFSEVGVSVDERELEEAADSLGGIIGWLTYYGWHRAFGGKSLREVVDVAARQEVEELRGFLVKSRAEGRYRAILKAVAEGLRRWSEIKEAVEAREGAEVDDHNFTKLLEHLLKMGILEKVGNEYVIADPVLHYGILRYL